MAKVVNASKAKSELLEAVKEQGCYNENDWMYG